MNDHQAYQIHSDIKVVIHENGDPKSARTVIARQIDYVLYYLGADGVVKTRDARILRPLDRAPVPLVVNAHYEVPREDRSLHEYLSRGWAVLTPICVPSEHLRYFAGDNLRFNTAMIDFARRLPDVDQARIAVRGTSAGGYQAMMQSAVHLGLNCAYDMCGSVNILHGYKYLARYGDLCAVHERGLPDEQKDLKDYYPGPVLKEVYDFLRLTGERYFGAYGMKDWRLHSPVTHLAEITHPVLMLHSTADLLLPLNAVTERYAYGDVEGDLPEGFAIGLAELVDDEVLGKPMDELARSDMEVHRIILSQEAPTVEQLRFTPGVKFSLNVLDEGKIAGTCGHFKDNTSFFRLSELAFLDHYLGRTAGLTNTLTPAKVKGIAQRYLGGSPLCTGENQYKSGCRPAVFGSLAGDRLSVLAGLKAYLDLDAPASRRVNTANLSAFLSLYASLENESKFFTRDPAGGGRRFEDEPVQCLLGLIDHYTQRCAGCEG